MQIFKVIKFPDIQLKAFSFYNKFSAVIDYPFKVPYTHKIQNLTSI